MIKDIFNFYNPTPYLTEDGEEKFKLPLGNEQMMVLDLKTIHGFTKKDMKKAGNPWIQLFKCGHRVTKDNIKWEDWNGFTQADVDSKLYYKNVKPFDTDKLLKVLANNGEEEFTKNFYCIQKSSGGLGYSIFWYWECERNEENFKKCCFLTTLYTKLLFIKCGKNAEEIINYKLGNAKVIDHHADSVYLGCYINNNPLLFNTYVNIIKNDFGEINTNHLDDYVEAATVTPITGDYEQKADLIRKYEIDKTKLKYYPHVSRRCIYEALIVVFDNKEKVDEEWKYIANLLPEGNGHNSKFYLDEPNKNSWFEKYNKNYIHKIDWLTPFGYEIFDQIDYVYKDQFYKSWYLHCYHLLVNDKVKKYEATLDPEMKESDRKRLISDFKKEKYEEYIKFNIFDDFFLTEFKTEEETEFLNQIRSFYYKNKFDKEDFIFLCSKYDIPKDIVTYKMYADFYYRDENNIPLIKYDTLENEVLTFSYWPESNKIQWHTLKYNDEYTHWKNTENFHNKTSKNDMRDAIEKYAKRWHNFHTIRQYLNNLDLSKANTELLETWAIRYFKAKDTKLTRTICKNFFIAAVKKQMIEKPNSFTFQHMLCLQGPTGCGKTFFLVNMFTINDKSFILNKIDPNGKDNEIGPLIAKNWLLQFGESENLTRVSVNAQKEFVDRMNLGMKFQEKYEKEQTTVYPRIVIARTTNEETFLNDMSIQEGDRRNWIIKCECEAMCCDEKMKELIRSEKDILWTTALKLYLDNPNADLELSIDEFKELAELQESAKVIKTEDVKETFNVIFERKYFFDNKNCILSERDFNIMVSRAEILATSDNKLFKESLDGQNMYFKTDFLNVIPAKWISNYIKKEYGNNYLKALTKYLEKHGWERKQNAKYNLQCWCRKIPKKLFDNENIFK